MMMFDDDDDDGENDEDYGAVFLPFALHTHAFVSMVQFCVSIVFVH